MLGGDHTPLPHEEKEDFISTKENAHNADQYALWALLENQGLRLPWPGAAAS